MASFTDSPQAYIPQYTPLVDLNLYAGTIGNQQEQYNKGVQRIQGSIDQVAGLDIMHPLAKEYLQSKLTEMGTKLNGIASGDFSNQSLVGQAMMLAPQVAKDEKVQNAVISTQQIRSLSAAQKKLYDTHPEQYPTSMRWMDNQGVSEYLNSTDLDQPYRGPSDATRYQDYHKGIEDLVKQIVPDVKFEINADGRYQWKTEKYTTVTNDRIQGVISGYLASNPEATKSLRADALYTYKDKHPEEVRQHMDEVYDKTTAELTRINLRYALEIKQNPADRDFITDRKAAMAANEKSIQEMASKRSLYSKYLQDPSKIDEVKQTVFTDNLKGMFSTVYQKDDIDRKIEENFNAKNADDNYWKGKNFGITAGKFGLDSWIARQDSIAKGLEPYPDKNGNPIALTSDSPYWPIYQAMLKGKGKSKDGSKGNDGELPVNDTPHPVGKNNPTGEFNNEELHTQVKDLGEAIRNVTQTGIEDKYYSKWKSTYGSGYPDESAARIGFQQFLQTQNNAFLNGDRVDPGFKEYHDRIAPVQLKIDALSQLQEKAIQQSLVTVPSLSGRTYMIRGVNYKKGNRNIEQIHVDLDKDQSFINDLTRLKQKFLQGQDGSDPKVKTGFKSPSSYYNDLVESYFKNSPNYAQLKGLVNASGGTNVLEDAFRNVLGPVEDLTSKRLNAQNMYLSSAGKDFAPQQYTFEGKKEELDAVKRRIFSYLSEKKGTSDLGGKDYDLSKYSPEDVVPIGAYVNAAGKTVYNYSLGKNLPDYITSTQPLGDNITPIDPDADLKRIISITKITPTKGDGVMTTKDGKIRFAIGEGTYGTGYDTYIIDQGATIPITAQTNDGDIFHGVSPSQIQKSLDDFAKMPSNSNPKVVMSREECYYRLTHTADQYEAKYPKPVKSN